MRHIFPNMETDHFQLEKHIETKNRANLNNMFSVSENGGHQTNIVTSRFIKALWLGPHRSVRIGSLFHVVPIQIPPESEIHHTGAETPNSSSRSCCWRLKHLSFSLDLPIKAVKSSRSVSKFMRFGKRTSWLVVSTPLKNMSSSVGMMIIPNIWKQVCSKPPTSFGSCWRPGEHHFLLLNGWSIPGDAKSPKELLTHLTNLYTWRYHWVILWSFNSLLVKMAHRNRGLTYYKCWFSIAFC